MSPGRTVLVTGATSGIGRATALRLAAGGDRLVLLARSESSLKEVAHACAAFGVPVETLAVDVRDREGLADAIGGLDPAMAPTDLVHSAGTAAYGRFEQIPPEVFDGVLAVNVLGTANVARILLPAFRRRGSGRLVIVGSVLGDVAVPWMTPYVVSKHAVRALVRQLRLENRDCPGVTVTLIAPGGVDTPIYVQAANYLGRAGRPPAPVVSPERVAATIVSALDHPTARRDAGPANALMRLGFTLLPGVYDRVVGPLFDLAALQGPAGLPATSGNVLEPHPEVERTDQGFGQGLGTIWRNAVARTNGTGRRT